jgi:hypothetical protein
MGWGSGVNAHKRATTSALYDGCVDYNNHYAVDYWTYNVGTIGESFLEPVCL